MAVVAGPERDRRSTSPGTGLVVLLAVVAAALVAVLGLAVRDGGGVGGSGRTTTDRRALAPFAAVELVGADTVTISVGPAQSVAVTGGDDVVDEVMTTVHEGSLVIANRGTFTSDVPMNVAVSVPSLDGVTLSGTGTVTVEGVTGQDFTADLSGAGTLVASGSVDRLTAVLSGVGTVELHGLIAREATSRLDGTGELGVHATSALEATLTGAGSITYSGSPAVTMQNTGAGSITGE
jgi:hypothetical protein